MGLCSTVGSATHS